MSASHKKEYKPLFNRTYLKYLGFVVAIAIVFLSEKAPSPLDQPTTILNAVSHLKVLPVDDLEQHRLLLSYPTQPALTNQQQIARNLEYYALRASAELMNNVQSILWTSDRLEITFRWAQPSDTPLSFSIEESVNQLLSSASKFKTVQQRKLVSAQLYVDNKAPDNQLLQEFNQRIASFYKSPRQLQFVLKSSPSALFITSSDLDAPLTLDIDLQFSKVYPQPANRLAMLDAWKPSAATILQRSDLHHTLIATQLANQSNVQSASDIMTNLVISQLLNQQFNTSDIQFRIIKKPIFESGYRALILSTQKRLSENSLLKIKNTLTQIDIDSDLSAIKERLISQYADLINNRERLFKLYSKKLYYQLPTQSDSEFEALLDDITVDQIRSQINKTFSESAIFIRLQPS